VCSCASAVANSKCSRFRVRQPTFCCVSWCWSFGADPVCSTVSVCTDQISSRRVAAALLSQLSHLSHMPLLKGCCTILVSSVCCAAVTGHRSVRCTHFCQPSRRRFRAASRQDEGSASQRPRLYVRTTCEGRFAQYHNSVTAVCEPLYGIGLIQLAVHCWAQMCEMAGKLR
jgi:hypothetical protein